MSHARSSLRSIRAKAVAVSVHSGHSKCGSDRPLEGNLGRVLAAINEGAVGLAVDCQECAESLELVARASST